MHVNYCQLFNQWNFADFVKTSQSKSEKSFRIKFTDLCLWQVYSNWLFLDLVIVRDKFTAEPLACSSWFYRDFLNVMMRFLINKTTDALNADVKLLNQWINY